MGQPSPGTRACRAANQIHSAHTQVPFAAQRHPSHRQLQERYLDLLEKGLKRLEETMRQLLNFGRKESLKLQNVSINELIEECFSLMQYRLKNITVNFDLQIIGRHNVDGEALRQVVVNLTLNAAEAMPEGGDLFVSTKEPILTSPKSGIFTLDCCTLYPCSLLARIW